MIEIMNSESENFGFDDECLAIVFSEMFEQNI